MCGVMQMSLQLHDCPLWPSVAPPAIDQGRVSRSLAASRCDEFISFSAAAVFSNGSTAVDGLSLCREGKRFLIASSFGGTKSGLGCTRPLVVSLKTRRIFYFLNVILCTLFSRQV